MGKIKSNRDFRARPRSDKPARARGPGVSHPTPALGFPTISLDELARRQGVKPLTDLNEVGALWPEEFNPDEFLIWLSGERTARGKASTDREPD